MSTKEVPYTLLKDTKPDKSAKYNLAGVIIDATAPYKTSKTLIVSLKIVDPSITLSSNQHDDSKFDHDDEDEVIKNSRKYFRNISIFHNNIQDEMPIVKNVGDIILLK